MLLGAKRRQGICELDAERFAHRACPAKSSLAAGATEWLNLETASQELGHSVKTPASAFVSIYPRRCAAPGQAWHPRTNTSPREHATVREKCQAAVLKEADPNYQLPMSTAIIPFAARQIPRLRFHSGQMQPRDALSFWRESLYPSWDLQISSDAVNQPFHSDSEVWRMDRLLFGRGTFGPTQVRTRREGNIRADQLDHYRLILLRSGQFDCDAGERRTRLTPGRYLITDMARAETNVSASDCIVMFIPRDQLDEALPTPIDLHGLSPNGPCGQLLSEHLSVMLEHLPDAAMEEIPGLSRATVNLVAASIASSAENLEAARPAMENLLLRRGRRFIEQHLHRNDLGTPQLCAELRVSRSTLYRVFTPVGGISQYIKERRLARIHEALARGPAGQSIWRLAEQYGFKSAAHFSTAFREQYGYSAREVVQYRPETSTTTRDDRLQGWLGDLMQFAT